METVKQKNSLKDGYYYAGYILQVNSIIMSNQVPAVALWDNKNSCFWLWEEEGNKRKKTKLLYLNDVNNDIEAGFYPLKTIIPKEDQVID